MATQLPTITFPKRGQVVEDEFVTQWENGMDTLQGEWTTNANLMANEIENAETIAVSAKDTAVEKASIATTQAEIALSVTNYQGDYSNSVNYAKGQTVTDVNNAFFISKVDDNSNNSLDDVTKWSPVFETIVLDAIELTEEDGSPLATSLNEHTSKTIKIANYDSEIVYYISATKGLINNKSGEQVITSDTFTYTSQDITTSANETDTIQGYGKHLVFTTKNLSIQLDVLYIPTSADTTIQVLDIYDDLDTNTGFKEIV